MEKSFAPNQFSWVKTIEQIGKIDLITSSWFILPTASFRRSISVVRAFAHCAMGRQISPIELFLIPVSAPWLV